MECQIIVRSPVLAHLLGEDEVVGRVAAALTVTSPSAKYSRAARFGHWDGKVHFLRRPANLFPTGLVARVKGVLEAAEIPVALGGLWGLSAPLAGAPPALHGITLRAYQQQAIAHAVAAKRCTIEVPTGGGKTEIGAEIARRFGGPVLWVVNTKVLLDQTADRLTALLPGIPVQRLGGGHQVTGLPAGSITVATVQTLARLDLPVPTWARFKTLIVDEAHHAGADTWVKVANKCTGAWTRVGLSGTLDRSPDPVRALRIEGALGPLHRVVSTETLVDQGFLARPHVHLLALPLRSGYPSYPEVRERVLPDWRRDPRRLSALGGKLFREAYDSGIVLHPLRNDLVLDVATKHVHAGEKVLMLCTRLQHGDLLRAGARLRRLPSAWISGQESNSVRTDTLNRFIKVEGGALLIASTILQEGVDLPSIDVLILAGGGASEIASIQRVGRALRPRPDKADVLVYDVLDGRDPQDPKDYLAQHSLDRVRTYRAQRFALTGLPAPIQTLLAAEDATDAAAPETL